MFFESIDWSGFFDGKNVNECYNLFLKHYTTAIDSFIPSTFFRESDHANRWLTREAKALIKHNKTWFKCTTLASVKLN